MSQAAGGDEGCGSDGGGISCLLRSLLGQDNITDSMHSIGFLFSFKNLTSVFKVITVYYSQFYFKIKQTSSFTVRQNKEAGEHENKNCGSFHLRRESPSSDIR